jgi:hypothetical protein
MTWLSATQEDLLAACSAFIRLQGAAHQAIADQHINITGWMAVS